MKFLFLQGKGAENTRFWLQIGRPPVLLPSPDPSDYHFFPQLKKHLKGTNLHSELKVVAATEAWLEAQHFEFFFQGLEKLKDNCNKFVNLIGKYVE